MKPKNIAIASILGLLTLIGGSMAVIPQYNVWQKELAGKARLHEAEWDKQILIEEANARKESATLLREAEIIRAEGVAEAMEKIQAKLKGEEGIRYVQYLWTQGLHDGTSEVIYVPTEANLPILEATKRN